MNVLVLNCGSSSLKFQLIATDLDAIERDADRELARGLVERIGSESLLTLRAEGRPTQRVATPLRDHRQALDFVLRWLVSPEAAVPGLSSLADVHAVGHRVVHGGEKLTRSVQIDDAVIEQIEDCIDLAPLHNPANLRGIRAARELFGLGVPQAAVFDTSFHSTMPPESFLYALPDQLYVRHRVR
ncbi:MAG TPA: acetate kinase, partial [Thermoanaerobaculia bacterium]|nr:acetate kinase [Thermoanaerobaculia bacterium]